MPRKKAPKRKPKLAQKQKQRQSVIVNINQQRKTIARPSMPKSVQPVQPSLSTSFSPIINFPQFPQYDNTSSIINAIRSSENRQPEIIKDVARVDVAEERAIPLRERRRELSILESVPQHQGLASEEFDAIQHEPAPQSIPINIVKVPVEKVNVRKQKRSIVKQQTEEELPVFIPSVEENYRELTQKYRDAEPTGILTPQTISQFPVPPLPEYVPNPIDLIPPPPLQTRSEAQFEQLLKEEEGAKPNPLASPNPYIPSLIRETVKQAREQAEEPPEQETPRLPLAPVRSPTLHENIKLHNQEIEDLYASRGQGKKEARKDPNYVSPSVIELKDGKQLTRKKRVGELEEELTDRGLRYLLPERQKPTIAEPIEEPPMTLRNFFPLGQVKGGRN